MCYGLVLYCKTQDMCGYSGLWPLTLFSHHTPHTHTHTGTRTHMRTAGYAGAHVNTPQCARAHHALRTGNSRAHTYTQSHSDLAVTHRRECMCA